MKRILLSLAVIAISQSSQAQIVNLEHTYSNANHGQVLKLEGEGEKYWVYDTLTKKHNLYNQDHSLWKTISYTLPAGSNYAGATCISTKFFNSDSKVEAAVAYWTLVTPNTAAFTTLIIDENGNVLQTLPDMAGLYPLKINGKWKAGTYDYSSYKWNVYSVPGTMPDPAGFKPEPRVQGETSIYPNPMSDAATLEYTLPAGQRQGTIEITNTAGQVLKTFNVTDQFHNVLIQRGELPAGTYIYKVTGSPAKPFVIQ